MINEYKIDLLEDNKEVFYTLTCKELSKSMKELLRNSKLVKIYTRQVQEWQEITDVV
jgi:L-rhamnose mutarotase